jgi:hypothetical protein
MLEVHAYSTFSDGELRPAEVVDLYGAGEWRADWRALLRTRSVEPNSKRFKTGAVAEPTAR